MNKCIRTKRLPFYPSTLYNRYNRYTLPLDPAQSAFITADPANIRRLMTDTKMIGVSPGRKRFRYLLGTGFFVLDGKGWSGPRSQISHLFSHPNLLDFTALEERIQRILFPVLIPGHTVNLTPAVEKVSLDESLNFLLGCDTTAPDTEEFVKAYEDGLWYINLSRVVKIINWVRPAGYRKAARIVRNWTDQRIDEASYREGTFLKAIEYCLPEEKRGHVLNSLFAGKDTTAAVVIWAIWNLVRRVDIMHKLREEVAATVGQDIPTFEKLQEMKLLRSVMNETMRLTPPVPMTNRESHVPVVLPVGGGNGSLPLLVPEGKTVMLDIFSMQRRRDIWGDDAEEWRPERWIENEALESQSVAACTFIPFGVGPRNCLGAGMAWNTAGYTIVRMLQEFKEIRKKEGESDEATFTSAPQPMPGNGVWITLGSRTDETYFDRRLC
ncbi:Similar to Cytochrome P450 52A13; acc. no. Q9Y758 [Pyronema omphalodes CBS 100304]|uniref:Similar to Cytochrome P450 52A13 acc. no. Q9Y758 n=1 Tax=Pyronema omphalodes (strain CBS 100304) TaxID=1076935 RepID=U4L3G3_PYROM|nr:Similar to Cytochrome P450 52A13; acc. no. Q9Y758 [Pyronema omphalodes CBS 100304]